LLPRTFLFSNSKGGIVFKKKSLEITVIFSLGVKRLGFSTLRNQMLAQVNIAVFTGSSLNINLIKLFDFLN